MSPLSPPGPQFFRSLHASALLYMVDGNGKITPDRPLRFPFDGLSSLTGLTDNDEFTDQLYVNPIVIQIPPKEWPTVTRGILVITVGSGTLAEDNRQAHVWRIDASNQSQFTADYLGAFGGAINNDISNVEGLPAALAAPAIAGSTVPKGAVAILQAPFVLVNTLTQHQNVPFVGNAGLSFDFTIPNSSTTSSPTAAGATSTQNPLQLDFGTNTGLSFPVGSTVKQTTPPPPVFVVTYNVFVGSESALASFGAMAPASPPVVPAATLDSAALVLWVPFHPDGNAVLDDPAKLLLRQWVDQIPNNSQTPLLNAIRLGQVPVHVTGYASTTGSPAENVSISRQRVDAVRNVLQGDAAANKGNRTTGGILGGETLRFDVRALGQIDNSHKPWLSTPPTTPPTATPTFLGSPLALGSPPPPYNTYNSSNEADPNSAFQQGRTVQVFIDPDEAKAGMARLSAAPGVAP